MGSSAGRDQSSPTGYNSKIDLQIEECSTRKGQNWLSTTARGGKSRSGKGGFVISRQLLDGDIYGKVKGGGKGSIAYHVWEGVALRGWVL